ncbi:MAG: hypothetical protein R3264_14470 [Anaerolineae bacterium]|nr:hypothetical protein [Anaerolineae bacterium]
MDGKAIGAVEAKKAGTTLSGVQHQSEKYSLGLPDLPKAWHKPLTFLYESTGIETYFTNGLDPEPRSRRVFTFHRPETLAAWVGQGHALWQRLRHGQPVVNDHLRPPKLWRIYRRLWNSSPKSLRIWGKNRDVDLLEVRPAAEVAPNAAERPGLPAAAGRRWVGLLLMRRHIRITLF